MLYHLHVKDLALIDSAEVEFGKKLNILTGETGAGKSIIIGSINLALGAKASKDMIRSGKDSALVELVFGDLSAQQLEKLAALDVYPEDGQIFIKRRISQTRSVIKINDELATLAKLRAVTDLLIDLHGQHEHQSLLNEGAHLRFLDAFISRESAAVRAALAEAYDAYAAAKKRLASFQMDEAARKRELDFLQFELDEIESAALKEGEEEQLAADCRRFQNAQQIFAGVDEARQILSETDISRAVRAVSSVLRYDEGLGQLADSLYDAESVLNDTLRELEAYLDEDTYDEAKAEQAKERLDQIRIVLMKYGGTLARVQESYEKKQKRLELLLHYDREKAACEKQLAACYETLLSRCRELSALRKKGAEELCARVRRELSDMGFLDVRFDLSFSVLPEPTRNGMDEAHFEVSLNTGEPLRPLSEVASGGELSRIMLSLKTVLADTDEIPTLIFDEIDTGISGMTAEKVSDKLMKIAQTHQVICITHLPQIAAKADTHFCIEKKVADGHTHTHITQLSEEASLSELARLLAGGKVTKAVLANAKELKNLASQKKKEYNEKKHFREGKEI